MARVMPLYHAKHSDGCELSGVPWPEEKEGCLPNFDVIFSHGVWEGGLQFRHHSGLPHLGQCFNTLGMIWFCVFGLFSVFCYIGKVVAARDHEEVAVLTIFFLSSRLLAWRGLWLV